MRSRAVVLAIVATMIAASCGSDSDDGAQRATSEPPIAGATTRGDESSTAADSSVSSETSVTSETTVSSGSTDAFDTLYAANPHAASEIVEIPAEFKQACEKIAADTPEKFRSGKLTIATSGASPGVSYPDPADPSRLLGYIVAMAEIVLTCTGVPFEFTTLANDGLFPALAAGRVDVVFNNYFYTPERAENADFVIVEEEGSLALLKPDSTLDVTERLDLCGLKIASFTGAILAVQYGPGGQYEKICSDAGLENYELNLFPSQPDALLALVSGRVDVAFAGERAARGYGEDFKTAFVDSVSNNGQAVQNGRTDLLGVMLAGYQQIDTFGLHEKVAAAYDQIVHPIPPEIKS